MRRIGAAVAITFVAIAALRPASAAEPPSPRIAQLQDWLQAVRSHEPGTADSHLTTLASWSNARIRALWIDAQALMHFVRCGKCNLALVKSLDGRVVYVRYTKSESLALREMADAIRERHEDDDVLRRAAILHADVVMLAHPEAEARVNPAPPPSSRPMNPPVPTPERLILKTKDGRQERLINDAIHWDIAYALLDRIPNKAEQPAPQGDATVRLWYGATIEYLQDTAQYDPLHFSKALKLFPDDAEIQFQNGCLHESLASPRVQEAMRDVQLPTGIVVAIKAERAELEAAEHFFRRAIEIDPNHQEARIRLGRVLGLLDHHEQARAELSRVTDAVDHVALRYYTALFLGREEETLGHRDAARAAYEHAAAMFPLAQSPQIALSHMAHEAGDRAAALTSAQRVLALPPNELDRQDPFWIYHFMQGRHKEQTLAALYQPFRRAGQ